MDVNKDAFTGCAFSRLKIYKTNIFPEMKFFQKNAYLAR